MNFVSHLRQQDCQDTDAVLNRLVDGFDDAGNVPRLMKDLVRSLHDLRSGMCDAAWRDFITAARGHRIAQILYQDPFTGWAFSKPRGYAGDAGLIDFIYDHQAPEAITASRVGRAVYAYTKNLAAAEAVRDRRDRLAALVDEVAQERQHEIEILTLAAGHLREADQSKALQAGNVRRWVALDHDAASTSEIGRVFAKTSVAPAQGSIRNLLFGKYDLGRFDLIYAAGLYDYLGPGIASRLTQVCCSMLKPGGIFLFGNFATGIEDDGYMEAFMDWHLIFRSEAEVHAILANCGEGAFFDRKVSYGLKRNILYGSVRRRMD